MSTFGSGSLQREPVKVVVGAVGSYPAILPTSRWPACRTTFTAALSVAATASRCASDPLWHNNEIGDFVFAIPAIAGSRLPGWLDTANAQNDWGLYTMLDGGKNE